jgi:DNA-binding CsgD family transcriptional regulator
VRDNDRSPATCGELGATSSGRNPSPRHAHWFAKGLFPSKSALSDFSSKLLGALGDSPIGIAICDRQLCFAGVNRKLAEINNIPPEEHVGRPIGSIVGDLASTVETRLERVFKTERPLHNAGLVGRLGANPAAGQWLENMIPILGRRGRVVQVAAFVVSVPGMWFPSGADGEPSRHPAPLKESPWGSGSAPDATRCISRSNDHRRLCNLSARETEVLTLLAQGVSIKQVSAILAISVKTVETYRYRLMRKLGASSLAQLVHFAIRHQLVELQG